MTQKNENCGETRLSQETDMGRVELGVDLAEHRRKVAVDSDDEG
jgi:hypothetical protein